MTARPVVTQNLELIAAINQQKNLCVYHVGDASRTAREVVLPLTNTVQALLPSTVALAWSKTIASEDEPARQITKLLLTAAHRVVILEIGLTTDGTIELYGVDADVEFPSDYGKLCAAEFVFNHKSVALVFELAPHLSILSLTEARRDDVPARKFPSVKTMALSHSTKMSNGHTRLAILVREKHVDSVVVMEQNSVVSSFATNTIDAQGILWSPNGNPVLMIWDSASFGLKVNFISATGHSLQQLNIVPELYPSLDPVNGVVGVGAVTLDWVSQHDAEAKTRLAIACGTSSVMVRSQDDRSLTAEVAIIQHPLQLDGQHTSIWEQVGPNEFTHLDGNFEMSSLNDDDTATVKCSSTSSYWAAVWGASCRIVLVWDSGSTEPLFAFLLQNDVRSLAWHAETLLISTAETVACFYACDMSQDSPRQVIMPRLRGLASRRWEGTLLREQPRTPSESTSKALFMFASATTFDAVRLNAETFPSVFG